MSRRQYMSMNKKLLLLLIITMGICVVVIDYFATRPPLYSPPRIILHPTQTTPPNTYLHYQNESKTNVFLVDSQLSYGVYEQSFTRISGQRFSTHTGDLCIIINGTIQNEYHQDYYFCLDAKVLNVH